MEGEDGSWETPQEVDFWVGSVDRWLRCQEEVDLQPCFELC